MIVGSGATGTAACAVGISNAPMATPMVPSVMIERDRMSAPSFGLLPKIQYGAQLI
jgi:hypothetical protein